MPRANNSDKSPEQLLLEIAKLKLAIGQQYRAINERMESLRTLVDPGYQVEFPDLGHAAKLVDHFAEKDQHWKSVPCDRFEVVLTNLTS